MMRNREDICIQIHLIAWDCLSHDNYKVLGEIWAGRSLHQTCDLDHNMKMFFLSPKAQEKFAQVTSQSVSIPRKSGLST
jgi:hypothetical protein